MLCGYLLDGELFTIEGSNIPGNVVAPAHGLNPVNSSSIDPHQVSRPLDEAIHWDVGIVEVVQHGPPRPCQIVHPMPGHIREISLINNPRSFRRASKASPSTHFSQKSLMACQ